MEITAVRFHQQRAAGGWPSATALALADRWEVHHGGNITLSDQTLVPPPAPFSWPCTLLLFTGGISQNVALCGTSADFMRLNVKLECKKNDIVTPRVVQNLNGKIKKLIMETRTLKKKMAT